MVVESGDDLFVLLLHLSDGALMVGFNVSYPVIYDMLLFFPNMPLWAKEVNAFGPGVSNAMAIMSNN